LGRGTRAQVDRERARSFEAAAGEFLHASNVARSEGLWSAAALLLVHASIAYADAVTIRLSGLKSTSDHHVDAATLLAEVAARTAHRDRALRHFRKILEKKNQAAYSGQSFREKDATALAVQVERFAAWCRTVLTN
jgi:hypothetical protein